MKHGLLLQFSLAIDKCKRHYTAMTHHFGFTMVFVVSSKKGDRLNITEGEWFCSGFRLKELSRDGKFAVFHVKSVLCRSDPRRPVQYKSCTRDLLKCIEKRRAEISRPGKRYMPSEVTVQV